MNEVNRNLVAEQIQNSSVSSDPRFIRKGLDAAGMTADFDAYRAKQDKEDLEFFGGDKAACQDYWLRTRNSRINSRESVRQYENQQVLQGAKNQSIARLDAYEKDISEYATLEIGRADIALNSVVGNGQGSAQTILDNKIAEREKAIGKKLQDDDPELAKFKKEYKTRVDNAVAAHTLAYAAVEDKIKKYFEDVYAVHFNDTLALEGDESVASAAACKEAGVRSKKLIKGLIDAGYMKFANGKLAAYENPTCTAVQEVERDKDGKIVFEKDENGNVKKDANGKEIPKLAFNKDGTPVYSKTEFNLGGRAWMSVSDVKELRGAYDKAISDEQTKKKNVALASEDAAIAAINVAGANGDAILSSPDYTYDQNEFNKQIDELNKQLQIGAAFGSKKITEAAQENLRRLRTKAQTMTSHRIEIEDRLTKRMSDESGAEIWEDYQTEMAQWNNDVVGEIVTSVMTVDASGKKMMSAQSIDQRFYLKKMCERLAHDERLNPQQREQVKADLADLNNKMDKRYASNATKLLRNVGFVIPDEQVRYVADRRAGEYAGLDGAPTGQWSDFVLVGENGKPNLGNSVTVDWVMPNSKKVVERPWFLPNSESQVEIKGLKRTELQYIAQEAVKKLKSLEYDPYDGKHEEERLDIERSIIDKIGLLAEGKNKAAVFDGMIDAIGKAETFRQVNNGSYVGQRMTGGFFGKIMLPSEERQQERLLELSKRNQKSEK